MSRACAPLPARSFFGVTFVPLPAAPRMAATKL